jgi:hypothetical protein
MSTRLFLTLCCETMTLFSPPCSNPNNDVNGASSIGQLWQASATAGPVQTVQCLLRHLPLASFPAFLHVGDSPCFTRCIWVRLHRRQRSCWLSTLQPCTMYIAPCKCVCVRTRAVMCTSLRCTCNYVWPLLFLMPCCCFSASVPLWTTAERNGRACLAGSARTCRKILPTK